MSKLWNLLESRLSDWITLKDDDFSVYEVIEIVDYSLDAGDVESFIYRNLDFMKEKNMVAVKINEDNGEKYFFIKSWRTTFRCFWMGSFNIRWKKRTEIYDG